MKYSVTLTRLADQSATAVIDADSREEATEKAMDKAGDLEFKTNDADQFNVLEVHEIE